jgi:KTSC domain
MELDRTRHRTPRQVPAMDRVRCARYFPRDEVLEVEFFGGGVCQHGGVPTSVYRALCEAPSRSTYYYREIVGRYAAPGRAD